MTLVMFVTVSIVAATPSMADEIDRLGRFTVKEVMASYSSRWPIEEAAKNR